jgi:two-component system sensor histidine kinase/response regulator
LEGYEVLGAENGRFGVELAQEHKPDLIICDVTMPELDGYGVLTELRQMPQTAAIPFIFLTARADRSFMRHGMELGADDYLTKPFSLVELHAAIDARLTRHTAITQSAGSELEQAKNTLVQLVSHELRTPLGSINTATEIISRQIGQLSANQLQELLGSIQRGGQRLNRLVDQIVMMLQLESGTLNHKHIVHNGLQTYLSEILIAAMDLARSFAYRQPDVIVHLDERDSDVVILCDTRALRHALAELITNAINFTPAGGQVTVAQWQAERRAWVSITDNGPGIPPDRLEYAFKNFQQIDRESREQQGIGLGLPLARQVIEVHGGTFELNSVVDTGTQVTISLPILMED